MEKSRNDVCGCCGSGMPAKVIDQSLVETGEWPALKAEFVPKPVDTARTTDRETLPAPSHQGRAI
jgi:hypothetical protein